MNTDICQATGAHNRSGEASTQAFTWCTATLQMAAGSGTNWTMRSPHNATPFSIRKEIKTSIRHKPVKLTVSLSWGGGEALDHFPCACLGEITTTYVYFCVNYSMVSAVVTLANNNGFCLAYAAV